MRQRKKESVSSEIVWGPEVWILRLYSQHLSAMRACKRGTHVCCGDREERESVDRVREQKEKEIEYAEVELKLTYGL